MRDIKFRGFYHFKKNALYPEVKKWVYGYLYMEGDVAFIKDGKHHYKVDPESVGQFTGLLDKNGTEIYERDIVKGFDTLYLVKYTGNAFGFHCAHSAIFTATPYQFEIIGDDHTNPELVKS